MFVRLFVDENLDRHVPISKQPKEKIQVIIFGFVFVFAFVFVYGLVVVIGMSQCPSNQSKWFGQLLSFYVLVKFTSCQANFFLVKTHMDGSLILWCQAIINCCTRIFCPCLCLIFWSPRRLSTVAPDNSQNILRGRAKESEPTSSPVEGLGMMKVKKM